MKRNIIAIIAAALLVFSLLPAGIAVASASSTARLTDGLNVFPGTGQSFTIQVNNTEPTLPILGGGTSINFIQVVLPTNAGITLNGGPHPAPGNGWTVHPGQSGPLQTITYRNGSLAPQQSLTLEFPADVLRPLDGDRFGEFRVAVSSDNGESQSNAIVLPGTTMTSHVRVLQVLPGTLRAVDPPGVRDGTGTTGQTIQYAFDVHNHARSNLTVQPNLSSSAGSDEITQGAPGSVPAGLPRTFISDVTLGAANSDRNSTFTATATATDANPSAQSLPEADVFRVHALVRFNIDWNNFQPTHVQSVDPVTYVFRVPVTKVGTQAFNLADGTLEFCDNTVALRNPQSFGGGSQSGTLEFGPTTINFDGDRIECTADVALNGTDGNGFDTDIEDVRANLIVIDNRIPIIDIGLTLPNDGDGDRQTMAKDGDAIAVAGTVDQGCQTLDHVRLEFTDGGAIAEATADQVSCSNGSFSVTFQSVDFGGAAADGRQFIALAQATSLAGRPGTGATEDTFKVDNVAPAFNFAQTIVIPEGPDAGRRGIRVSFAENNAVLGGCHNSQWEVDEQLLVLRVLYSDGERCQSGQAGPDNDRILVVPADFATDWTGDIRYIPRQLLGTSDRAKDGAGHFAAENIVRAVVGILPPVPDLLEVRRNNRTEEARLDEGRYWTRFSGDDLDARFGRGQTDWLVEVWTATIDEDDNCLPTTRLTREPVERDGDGQTWTDVPIGQAEGDYVRAIRLRNDAGVGPGICLTVALDQTNPELVDAALVASDRVQVTLSEPVFNTNVAAAWWVWEDVENRDDQAIGGRDYYPVQRVTGERSERELEVELGGNGPFGGADYRPDPGDDRRLEDRAGNLLLNTIEFN